MASVQDLVKQILLAAHPVGSYYWSSESTDPGTLFGGTWERVKGRFVYASDADTAGATGGASSHTHTTQAHALTIAEMPSHTHNERGYWTLSRGGTGDKTEVSSRNEVTGDPWNNKITATGGGAAHSHGDTGSASSMPPYITAFCWRRTA